MQFRARKLPSSSDKLERLWIREERFAHEKRFARYFSRRTSMFSNVVHLVPFNVNVSLNYVELLSSPVLNYRIVFASKGIDTRLKIYIRSVTFSLVV